VTTALLTRPGVGAPQVFGAVIPARLPFLRRILKHPRLMHYNRLVALVMAVNLGWLVYGVTAVNWWTSGGADLSASH
jgi:hypothetical protein